MIGMWVFVPPFYMHHATKKVGSTISMCALHKSALVLSRGVSLTRKLVLL